MIHHGLLQKMRDGSTDQNDYMRLLQSTMPVSTIPALVVRSENKLRHCLNLMQMVNLAMRSSRGLEHDASCMSRGVGSSLGKNLGYKADKDTMAASVPMNNNSREMVRTVDSRG